MSTVVRLLGSLIVFVALNAVCTAAQVMNTSTGQCVEVQGGNVTNGTPVDAYQCTGSLNQVWTIDAGRVMGIGGSCLDVMGSSSIDSASVVIVGCNGKPTQNWVFAKGQIIGVGGKCLDVADSSTSGATRLFLAVCTISPRQRWLVQ
jgi:hypothetical protein